jgi:carbon starvation protein
MFSTILPLILVCAVTLLAAYFLYGRLLMRWLGVDANRSTPAIEQNDGNDFCPAPAPVVLGGHFTAIAAAGPIVGPILAGYLFGWLPAVLWIVLGAIFIGGIHDAGSLLASIRHNAGSITQVVRQQMSRAAYITFLLFVWLSLIYVVIAFANVTAGTFAQLKTFTLTTGDVPQQMTVNGGAVAIGATAYLILSVLMGLCCRFTRVPWWATLALAATALGFTIWVAPVWADWLSGRFPFLWFLDTASHGGAALTRAWSIGLLVYCFFASVIPMWLLLQPRGAIGATFLYAALAFGVVGTLVGGWSGEGSLAIRYPAFTGFTAANGAMLFPILFITIACGACSGFHSVVASGTTSKQIRSERDIKSVAYGAMLLEAMVAVFSLACLMVLAKNSVPVNAAKMPLADEIYAGGIGNFMQQIGISWTFAVGFGLLAFSSFVFDTLDVCTRLGRYVLQELTGLSGGFGAMLATLITLALPAGYIYFAPKEWGFATFWTIFGTSNQLLAALTLVGVSVWLHRTGRPVWFALLPAIFMLITTGTALGINGFNFYRRYNTNHLAPDLVNLSIAVVLFLLGLFVVLEAGRALKRPKPRPEPIEV